MHLHFASTPSRSNASILEVARQFRDRGPGFTLSTSGFHSLAHLLVRLRLGTKYIACFFGDNYPAPRPNALYQGLWASQPGSMQLWSLLSYVEALRAGALGHPFAVTRSLAGTDTGRDLQDCGQFTELRDPHVGLVRAMRPDITFVHALMGDAMGNVVVSAPSCEGFWAANGARKGVVVTVEKIVPSADLGAHRDSMPIARSHVLAMCLAPRGAHPQPLYAMPRFGSDGYADDFVHYRLWRELATDDALFAAFQRAVLEADDGAEAYAAYVARVAAGDIQIPAKRDPEAQDGPDVMLILAARGICERVKTHGYRTVLAGIGRSFAAARLAKSWLLRQQIDVDIVVETGLVGIACGAEGHPFLLSHRNMAQSAGLSNAEDALGLRACGADNRCLGVIGAAQVDALGNVNSTLSPQGRFLVGSGGANDIAAAAREVMVLAACHSDRLVDKVHYVTSAGTQVAQIITDRCVLSRTARGPWQISQIYGAVSAAARAQALADIRAACPWKLGEDTSDLFAAALSTDEQHDIEALHASEAAS